MYLVAIKTCIRMTSKHILFFQIRPLFFRERTPICFRNVICLVPFYTVYPLKTKIPLYRWSNPINNSETIVLADSGKVAFVGHGVLWLNLCNSDLTVAGTKSCNSERATVNSNAWAVFVSEQVYMRISRVTCSCVLVQSRLLRLRECEPNVNRIELNRAALRHKTARPSDLAHFCHEEAKDHSGL
jgi:hypothetical protein